MNLLLRSKMLFASTVLFVFFTSASKAQTVNTGAGKINTVTTAVPFLRIVPDARAGGMGDVGIASPTDANGLYLNPAKMAFIDKDFGFAVTFSPWLKALVNDIYLVNINGYYKVKKMQTIALSVRYFSLGNITFTDVNGQETGQFRPNEFAIDGHYARVLGKYFSIAASLRFIYSNLAGGQGGQVKAGIAGSGDISWYFKKRYNENKENKFVHEFAAGMNISNIGSKITYNPTNKGQRDYIPTNLGLGFGYTLDVDKHSTVGAYVDFNKLLVPSPDTVDNNNNAIYDFREKSPITGMFTSFGDAPGGFKEEMREITIGAGVEYMYNKQFGARFGYFYEPSTKGNRQFLTAGLTVKYSVVGLNFSYLIPTTIQRNPLDNTLRFSLLFDFAKGGKKAGQNNTGVSLVDDGPKKKSKKEKELQPTENVVPVAPVTPEVPLESVPPLPKKDNE
ncbi:MAG: type IX secretion system outer membrane channel protein PorV [Bacteroidetes bacterium]|nr:type IX secretion system outer membrane channel protein PorV [Bacteroidota bacterium]